MRRKIRKYITMDYAKMQIQAYIDSHADEIIQHLLDETGFDSIEKLREFEYHSGFGFDCGFVTLEPRRSEMLHEWELDNGKYFTSLWFRFPYECQSVTCKEIQLEKVVKDMNIDDMYYIRTRLD